MSTTGESKFVDERVQQPVQHDLVQFCTEPDPLLLPGPRLQTQIVRGGEQNETHFAQYTCLHQRGRAARDGFGAAQNTQPPVENTE